MIIKRIFQVVLISVSLYSVIFWIPWSYLLYKVKPIHDSIQQEIDFASETKFEGVIVSVYKNGSESVYTSGWHDRDAEVKAYPEALYKVASISKLYLASAVSIAIDEGHFSLDDTVADLLPDYADLIENSELITVRHLLSHRSGIFNYVTAKDWPWNPPKTFEGTMEYAINKGSLFAPGSKYKYSNTNYAILGEIITREVGYSYKQYLEEKIFIPLNLENTFNNLDEADYDEVMGGYIYDYEPNIKEVSHYSPGGSMVISVSDVVKFINALRGDFLNENAKAIYESVYTYDHTGLLPGYQSIARYDEASETLIVLFTNTTGQYSWGYIEDLYTKILKISNK